MVEIENKQEDGIKNEDFENEIKNLINQINKLKDENKDNDKLIGIFEQGSQSLDNGLYNSLNNCDINTLNEIKTKVSRIYNESYSIGLDINTKSSLKSLLVTLTNIINKKNGDKVENQIDTISENSENGTYIEVGGTRILEQKDDKGHPYITREGEEYTKFKTGKEGKCYYIPDNKTYIYIGEIEYDLFNGYGVRIDEYGNNYRGLFEDDDFNGNGVYSRAESGNTFEGYFENDLMQNGIIKTKGIKGEELYRVERDKYKGLKITTGDKKGKYIDKYTGYIVNKSAIKDLIKEQIKNIERIWKIGIKVYEENFELVKDLTKEQIDNIERIMKTGIEINRRNLYNVNDLTKEQVDNIERIMKTGIDVNGRNLDNIKDLTNEQVDNIERIMKIGIDIYLGYLDNVKDLTKEQIDNIERICEFGFDVDIYNILELSEFNQADFEILGINSDTLYESYDYTESEIESHQYYKKGKIIENIEDYIQNVISENRDLGRSEIIEHVRSSLITLPIKERINIIISITEIVHKFNTVRKYLDFNNPENEYKTPKDLLCAMRGIKDPDIISKITNNITVVQHGVGMTFFVGDPASYEKIYNLDSNERSETAGFQSAESYIDGLQRTLSVINGENLNIETENNNYGLIGHEGQHNRNLYFMPDEDNGQISNAKDEITAYLRGGTLIFKDESCESRSIEEILTEDGGLYQYGLEGEEWEEHKKQIRELLSYANDLINLTIDNNTGLTRDNIISMLSGVPIEQRKNLHDNIIKEVNTHNTRESLNEFRRAGTAERQTTIDEILVANTIEEVKHILSDPKYSHITWPPNNKCGLEISAIIDEVITGNLEITFVPSEIRPKIEQLILK